jgi:hypothetical protein
MTTPNWSYDDVATLIEKGSNFIVELVRTFKDPGIVLRKITDRTQELKDARRAIDDELRDKYAEHERGEDDGT